jgi:hypothetical protein
MEQVRHYKFTMEKGETRKKTYAREFTASSAAKTFDDDAFGVDLLVLLPALSPKYWFGCGGA